MQHTVPARRQMLYLFLLALFPLVLLLLGGVCVRQLVRLTHYISPPGNPAATQTALDSVSALLPDVEASYLNYARSRQSAALAAYWRDVSELEIALKELARLTSSQPQQQERTQGLTRSVRERLRELKENLDIPAATRQAARSARGLQALSDANAYLAAMRRYEMTQQKTRRTMSEVVFASFEFSLEMAGVWGVFSLAAQCVLIVRSRSAQLRVEQELHLTRSAMETRVRARTGNIIDINHALETQIAEQKRQIDILDSLLRQYSRILDSAEEGVCAVDLQGNVTYVNLFAARMLGWEPSGMIGQSMHQLIHTWRSDGTPYPAAECPVHKTLEDGVPRRIEKDVYWHKDGTSMPVIYTCAPIREGAGIRGAVVIFSDASHNRRNEEQWRRSRELLDRQIQEGLSQLTRANVALENEITERLWVEEKLERANTLLEMRAEEIEKMTEELNALRSAPGRASTPITHP